MITVELRGWDTHRNQGGARGLQADLLRCLAAAVSTFLTDLGSIGDDVLLVTLSEFGRTLQENGTAGTEHGHGNCSFVFGNRLKNGPPVVGEWPGLSPADLHEGRDLDHTVDFRDLYADILVHHLRLDDLSRVLPGWRHTSTGLFP